MASTVFPRSTVADQASDGFLSVDEVADKTADKISKSTPGPCRFWQRLLTKLLTKRMQTRVSEILTSLFCMVSAEGIEPSTY
jgi:hypothetical protein